MQMVKHAENLAEVYDSFQHYMESNREDLVALVGPFTGDITYNYVEEETQQGWDKDSDGLHIHILPSVARKVVAASWACRWANGVLVTPTLVGLIRTGVIGLINAPTKSPSIQQIGETLIGYDNKKNLGNLWGALHLLELQGWARRDGRDSQTCFHLTPLGKEVVKIVEEHWLTFQSISVHISVIKDYHSLCHNPSPEVQGMASFLKHVANCNDNWGLPLGTGGQTQRLAARQLKNCLDGLVMGSSLVALGMPIYEKQGNRITAVVDSVFSRFGNDNNWIDHNALTNGANKQFIDSIIEWMSRHGLSETDNGRVRLTEDGLAQVQVVPPLAALGVSYLKSYQQIDQLLTGNPDPYGIDNDNHVDRVMNVYASSGAGSGPAAKTINDKVIRHLFDELPLEQQPAGIADMGCGDGSALKRLCDYVIQHTHRGKNLKEFPLVVVGADYNDAPLERTRETLSCYETVEGVRVAVVKADITRPDEYNQRIIDQGINVSDSVTGCTRPLQLSDLLHTFMFLVHNRRLSVKTMREAYRVISDALSMVDTNHLDELMATYFNRPLPQSHDERLETVMDCFDVSFSDVQGLVPGAVAGADLVDFLLRWKPYAKHGLMSLEGHSPSSYRTNETIPEDDETWMRTDKLPHPLNWGMHFQSRQYMMPFDQYMLAMTLAGYEPRDGKINGSLYPETLPFIDQLPEFRFFSIACYVESQQ